MEEENKGGELRREEKTTRFLALWNPIHGGVQSKKVGNGTIMGYSDRIRRLRMAVSFGGKRSKNGKKWIFMGFPCCVVQFVCLFYQVILGCEKEERENLKGGSLLWLASHLSCIFFSW